METYYKPSRILPRPNDVLIKKSLRKPYKFPDRIIPKKNAYKATLHPKKIETYDKLVKAYSVIGGGISIEFEYRENGERIECNICGENFMPGERDQFGRVRCSNCDQMTTV